MNKTMDCRRVARGTVDRCCAGDPLPTAWNLGRVLLYVVCLACYRCASRIKHQPRRTLKWGVW